MSGSDGCVDRLHNIRQFRTAARSSGSAICYISLLVLSYHFICHVVLCGCPLRYPRPAQPAQGFLPLPESHTKIVFYVRAKQAPQLANFKFADDGSAHPGAVVPHDSPILTALLSDSSGTHGPAAPDLAKTFNVPGTVMSDAASDKFIFAENVGHDMVVGLEPDMAELDHTVPANIQHLLDAAHDTNAVSTLDPNHATAPQDMTTVQLPHHHGDFHFA